MPTFKQLQNPFCALRRKVTEIRGLQSFKLMVVFPLYVHRTASLAVYFDYHLKEAIDVLYSGRWVQVQFLLWILDSSCECCVGIYSSFATQPLVGAFFVFNLTEILFITSYSDIQCSRFSFVISLVKKCTLNFSPFPAILIAFR